jgi:hypothetical protein
MELPEKEESSSRSSDPSSNAGPTRGALFGGNAEIEGLLGCHEADSLLLLGRVADAQSVLAGIGDPAKHPVQGTLRKLLTAFWDLTWGYVHSARLMGLHSIEALNSAHDCAGQLLKELHDKKQRMVGELDPVSRQVENLAYNISHWSACGLVGALSELGWPEHAAAFDSTLGVQVDANIARARIELALASEGSIELALQTYRTTADGLNYGGLCVELEECCAAVHGWIPAPTDLEARLDRLDEQATNQGFGMIERVAELLKFRWKWKNGRSLKEVLAGLEAFTAAARDAGALSLLAEALLLRGEIAQAKGEPSAATFCQQAFALAWGDCGLGHERTVLGRCRVLCGMVGLDWRTLDAEQKDRHAEVMGRVEETAQKLAKDRERLEPGKKDLAAMRQSVGYMEATEAARILLKRKTPIGHNWQHG